MTRITDMRSDLQPESSGWLFKSPLTGAGAVVKLWGNAGGTVFGYQGTGVAFPKHLCLGNATRVPGYPGTTEQQQKNCFTTEKMCVKCVI